MAFEFQGRSFQKIGVIGSGQIGPDIALYFAKVLCRHGVQVVVVDISEEALAKGEKKLHKKIDRGQESGAFSMEWATGMKEAVTFTSDYGQLADAQFIVEAATEDKGLKGRIFGDLEKRCAPDTIFASNSSHLEPEMIFEGLEKKDRSLVIHYFFPAERNPMLEIVPSKDTAPDLSRFLLDFFEVIGKCPILAGSRYGYALDPVFEGVFQAAALLAENGVGTTKEIDAVACKALRLTVGPFTAMNLTGGNPITAVGLDNYTTRIHSWYRTPQILKDQLAKGERWDVPGRGEKVEVDAAKTEAISTALQGAFFGICSEIVDAGVSNVNDMDMGVQLGLDMMAPFSGMNRIGTDKALALVKAYAASNPGFPVPAFLEQHGSEGRPFEIHTVLREDRDGVAVLTIRRPRVLNALDQSVFDELEARFAEIQADDSIQSAVITGFGVKAFVSGADVNFLSKIESVAHGAETSAGSQRVFNLIEDLGKPVVCAYNGLAFGGGNELAMSCSYRIACKGIKPLAAQPEVNLGIIPGAGATQRLPRLIGFETAARLLRTGRAFSAAEAHEMGLVQELFDGNVVDLKSRAVAIAKELVAGTLESAAVPGAPMSDVPASLPDAELGHLSTAVDRLLCEAILEGAVMDLKAGIALEALKFGEVCGLEDMRIGVENFLTKGPRSKAPFVNR
jgi:enoyl-CoA hydratase / 3-hydroxyacyl-CoA dehydrogenase